MLLFLEASGATPQVTGVIFGPLLEPGALDTALRGGTASIITPGASGLTPYRFVAWKPSP